MREATRHAVFIEPHGDLRDLVILWKERVASLWPAAPYLSHPPHSTLWVGDLHDEEAAGRALAERLTRVQGLYLALKSPCIFYDDAMAGGGQTCVFGAVLTEGLAVLQRIVCDSLKPFREEMGDEVLPVPLRRDPFLASWREYGFPFVGPHWIPHFSVASLPARRDDPMISEFLAVKIPEATEFRLGWWRVTGEAHDRLAELALASSETC